MGVDRNTNNNNATTATTTISKDNLQQQQQQQQQQPQVTNTLTLTPNGTLRLVDFDPNNNNNNNNIESHNNCLQSELSSASSTPTKSSEQKLTLNHIQKDDPKIRSRSPNHVSPSIASKVKHLKLNTAKALQQQQEQVQQQQQQQQQPQQQPQRQTQNQQHNQQSQQQNVAPPKNRHQQQPSNNHEYLAQLLKDKRQLLTLPSAFAHVHRILDNEINRVRITLLHQNSEEGKAELPEPDGEIIILTKKLFVPQKDYPDFNFVGRILGPRGMTAKQLEQDTGCKIMIRGKGSMRDKDKEDTYKGKPNWEHLDEDLHVLISVEDAENRANVKLARAVKDVQKLLVPSAEGEDSLKKLQLMELAIINGTYRDLGRPHLQGQMAQIIPMTSGLTSPQVGMTDSSLIGQANQAPPPTPTLVTTPVLLTPRIASYFPPPGVLTRTSMMNPGQQQNNPYSMDLQQFERQQMNSGLVFQIDPNYVAVHHSPFLEFALFGGNNPMRPHPQPTPQTEEEAIN